MASIYDNDKSSTIIVGGVKMTMVEYKKYLKEKAEAKPKKKKAKAKKVKVSEINLKEISGVSDNIEKLLGQITALKSFSAYYDHAYRQWGTIANEILEHKKIRPHFVFYRVAVRELEALIADVQKMAKRNERAAYQYVEKISWKLEDIKEHINNIMTGAHDSGLLEAHKNHECINGKGRRLGLQTLVNKAYKAISQLEDTIGTLQKIADEGVDVMNEGAHMSPKARARCWA